MTSENLAFVQQMAKILEARTVDIKETVQVAPSDQIRRMVTEMQQLLSANESDFEEMKRFVKDQPEGSWEFEQGRKDLFEAIRVTEHMIDLGYTLVNTGLGELSRRGEQL